MSSVTEKAAETIEKLAVKATDEEKRANSAELALDMAISKLAHYIHMEEVSGIANEMVKKGYIADTDYEEKVDDLYKMSVDDLGGIRRTLGLMSNPLPSWGNLEPGDTSGIEGSQKTSNECLEGILGMLKSR